MKIAVLGANGFVGSSLAKYFARENLVIPVTRGTINLLDPVSVKQWLIAHKFDVVINAATTMQDSDSLIDTRNNLGLFMNFYNNKNLFGKLINFSSGAEFDRRNDIDQYNENQIFNVLPIDSYGFGQNMKSRISAQTENFYTIRIFNCFGLGEIASRIFPKLLQATSAQPLTITNDREFDYFGIRDLCSLTSYFLDTSPEVKDVNAVYFEKFKISTVVTKFCDLNNLEKNFIIQSSGGNRYTGNGRILSELPVQLLGLDNELKHYNEPLY
jgi:dTDP-4-dehydrorhamnose reductase